MSKKDKKDKRIKVQRIVCVLGFMVTGTPLDTAMKRFTDLNIQYQAAGWEDLYIEVETEIDYGGSYHPVVHLCGHRLETDEEMQQRLYREKLLRENKEAYDKKEYARLQEKYADLPHKNTARTKK